MWGTFRSNHRLPLISPHGQMAAIHSHTLPNTLSLLVSIFFFLRLTALIKHWIHAVSCLLLTVWGRKHTHQTPLGRKKHVSWWSSIHYFKKHACICVHSVRELFHAFHFFQILCLCSRQSISNSACLIFFHQSCFAALGNFVELAAFREVDCVFM